MHTTNLAGLYDLPAIRWERVRDRLDAGITQAPGTGGPDHHAVWLSTVNPDGTPHVTAVGVEWQDGGFWFTSGLGTRKGRNLQRDGRCTIAVGLTGVDVVLEGTAALVTDPATVERVATIYQGEGWPARPDDSGQALTAPFNAPSAGPAPWHVFRFTPTSATAVLGEEPGGATRWTF
ncbi:pyridoxamine 5'-phosphate oxidase family protein [Xylanimonas sp. McL0601]|uniref:pyridoxamine 5'-phosphate oxidase family protein n=1 Tax=Xylanimonas sp. McL0601 TaxID=3414739 RepID=UPI003CFB4527